MHKPLAPQVGIRTGLGGFLTPTRKRSEVGVTTLPSPTTVKLGRTSVSAQRKDRPTVQSLLQQIRSPVKILKSSDKNRYAPPIVTKGPSVPSKGERGGSGLKISGNSMPLKYKKTIVDFTRTPGAFTKFDLDNHTTPNKTQTLLGDSGAKLQNQTQTQTAIDLDSDDDDIPGFGKLGGVGSEGFVNILLDDDEDEVFGAIESKLAELTDIEIDLKWIKSNPEDTIFVLGLPYNRVCFLNSFIKILDIYFHVILNLKELSVVLPLGDLLPSPPRNFSATAPNLHSKSQNKTPGSFITELAAKNKGNMIWNKQPSGQSTVGQTTLSEAQKHVISKALYYFFKTAEENAHNYSFEFPVFCTNFERLLSRCLNLSESFRLPIHKGFVRLFQMMENNVPLVDNDDYLQLVSMYLNVSNATLEKQIAAISRPAFRTRVTVTPPTIEWDQPLDLILKRQTIRTLLVRRSGLKLSRHFELLRDLLVICPVGNPVVVAYLYSALSSFTKYSQTLKLLQEKQSESPTIEQMFQAVYLSLAEWAATQIPALPVLAQPSKRVNLPTVDIPESERNLMAEGIGRAFENFQRHWQNLVLFEIGLCVSMDALSAKETIMALQKLVKAATVRPDTDPCQLFLLCSRILCCLETYLGSLVVYAGNFNAVKPYGDLAGSLGSLVKLIRAQGREDAPHCKELLKQLSSLSETLTAIQRVK